MIGTEHLIRKNVNWNLCQRKKHRIGQNIGQKKHRFEIIFEWKKRRKEQ
jgi:hypothetical protein